MWLLDFLLLPRSTRELAYLNKIWGAFNDGLLDSKQTRLEIHKYKWKYHLEKIDLLVTFTTLK
jgi:hypothetical protein